MLDCATSAEACPKLRSIMRSPEFNAAMSGAVKEARAGIGAHLQAELGQEKMTIKVLGVVSKAAKQAGLWAAAPEGNPYIRRIQDTDAYMTLKEDIRVNGA